MSVVGLSEGAAAHVNDDVALADRVKAAANAEEKEMRRRKRTN